MVTVRVRAMTRFASWISRLMSGPTRFRQHDYRWRNCLEPRTTVIVPVRASRAIENCAHNLQALDRGGRRARRESFLDERLERRIMDPARLEMTDMHYQHTHMPGDGVYRTLVPGSQ
jgi:hypothetical protein